MVQTSEPVAELTGSTRLLWRVLGPIHTHIIRPMRDLRGAIARRLNVRAVREE